jgi:hypothetical protein
VNIERDRAEILKIHRDWWHANVQFDIELMRTCFPSGMNYLMFNYNWHPYFGIAEKIRLWEYYKSLEVSMLGEPDVRIMKFEVIGDLAYIADEFEVCTAVAPDSRPQLEEPVPLPAPGESAVERGRGTEIYKRDDGEGRPIWKMWHFHCSPLPPSDAQRPGFDDTAESRGGLGWNPWGEPLRVRAGP